MELKKTTKSDIPRKRKSKIDINNSMYTRPLQQGWKREFVIRTKGKWRKGDIYYLTPENRKLRTLRDIQKYLENSPKENNALTINCFTFSRQFLGICNQSKEIIRNVSINLSKNPYKRKKLIPQSETSNNELYSKKNKNKELSSGKSMSENSKEISDVGQGRIIVNNPIYTIPFEQGWRREFVTRSNGKVRRGDVYYFTPDNQKMRSLNDVQKYLTSLPKENNTLTIENFTFVRQSIGIGDESKEIVRMSALQLPKNKSILKKGKIKSKNSNIDRPNSKKNKIKRLSPGQSFKGKNAKNKSSSKITKSNTVSKASTSQNNETCDSNTHKSRRLKTNSKLTTQAANNITLGMNHVLKYLELHELLKISSVCKNWNKIAMNDVLWQNFCLTNSMIIDWKKCIDTFNIKCAIKLDTRYMFIPRDICGYNDFWLCFSNAIQKAKKLISIDLYRCPTYVVEHTSRSLPQLQVLQALIGYPTRSMWLTSSITLDLNYLENMRQLTTIIINGPIIKMQLLSVPSLQKLTNLKVLSLTSITSFPKDICVNLLSLNKHLEILEIGDCDCLSKDFMFVLYKLINLKSLRLENCTGIWNEYSEYFFRGIRKLEKLRILQLININLSNSVQYELEKCKNIKALLIILDYKEDHSKFNYCLEELSKTLNYLIWGIPEEMYDNPRIYSSYTIQKMAHLQSKLTVLNESSGSPISIIRNTTLQPDMYVVEKDKENMSDNFEVISVQALDNRSSAMTKIIKIPNLAVNQIYIAD